MSETLKSVWLMEVRHRARKNGKWSEWEHSGIPDAIKSAYPYYPADRVIREIRYERRAVEYTRAPHPSHAAVEAMEQAAQTLADGMETCHVCRGTVLVEEGAVNCEDCSACCDDHEEPECPTLYDLHLDLKRKLAAYRATQNKDVRP